MGRKVLISFVGTGRPTTQPGNILREYRSAKYSMEGHSIGESSFVASILYDHLQIDTLLLIGTAKSMWEEVYKHFSNKNSLPFDEDYYLELADNSEKSNHLSQIESIDLRKIEAVLGNSSKAMVIPYGINKTEQITIFKIIATSLNTLEDGDEIILDITHSFRSLPLFSTAVINYFKEVNERKVRFSKIYYGMLDAIQEFNGMVPIIDISSTLELNQWSSAAHSFQEYGKGYLLAELLGGQDGRTIKSFSDAVNLNFLSEIKSKLTNFKKLTKSEYLENEFAKWILPKTLNNFIDRLHKSGASQYKFQFELSCWHRDRKNYAIAYLVFVESIITYACETNKLDWSKKETRDEVKNEIIKNNLYNLKSVYESANLARKNIAHNLNDRVGNIQTSINNLSDLQSQFLTITRNQK